MAPYRVIFIIFPIAVIVLTILLKTLFKSGKATNCFILFKMYILSNISLYMLVEGVFTSTTFNFRRIIEIFTDLYFRQWIDILLVPNTFTFMYIAISFFLIWVIDKVIIEKMSSIHVKKLFVNKNIKKEAG
ncbi:hypothetical protein ACFYKX_06080 [Cytobacillus sp. FJAT-54145]|uniref:Uncharacterized protein n=1 Tax=Cytobacillus spartinae TaxID=3299023 RepID=A0ABW6K7I8_9BACI